jgi:hypothetical protein
MRLAARSKQQKLVDIKKHREHLLKNLYGLTVTQYNELLDRQDYRCAVNGCEVTHSDDRPLLVDHDHKTGIVRGLLCNKHNLGIGQLGDTEDGVAATLVYLQAANRAHGITTVGKPA